MIMDNTIHVKFDEVTTMGSKHNCLGPETNQFHDNDSTPEDTSIPSKEDLDNLFGLMFEEYFEKRFPEVSINSAAQTTPNNQDTPLSSSIIVEDNEAPPLEAESSSTIVDPLNSQVITLVQPSTHVWTKAHPLDQVIGDPSRPVMIRSRLVTNLELCMYALTISIIEPKNIKEAMADHSWIESMQDELHQF
ncbi:hypothetical protein Tco_0232991 [Tanacetum coccineum]